MRKSFLIYEEMRKYFPYMMRPLVISDFAPDPSEFRHIYGENFIFLLSVHINWEFLLESIHEKGEKPKEVLHST